MPNFIKKTLANPERICLRLRTAREANGLSLQNIAEQTKINPRYLLALEECRFNDIPFAPIYQKNFIKKYALAIGADPEEFVSQYLIEEVGSSVISTTTKKLPRLFLTAWPNIIRSSVLALSGILLVLYLGQQVRRTISPPELALVTPDNGFISHENTIALRGTSEPETKIMVNGQTIKSDDVGDFNEPIALNPGANTIVVEAQKKHGKTTQIIRHIVYKESPSFSLKSNILDTKN